jgi:branched-chain amino acid transport system substrate-binding protein
MQILEQAVKGTGTLDDGKLADYIHKNEFDTIVGKIRFDARGEWANPRLLMIQYQNIQGNNLDQYRRSGKAVNCTRQNTKTVSFSIRSPSKTGNRRCRSRRQSLLKDRVHSLSIK